jgi:hypothetical protein
VKASSTTNGKAKFCGIEEEKGIHEQGSSLIFIFLNYHNRC